MPAPVCTRAGCNRPVPDAFLCDDCTREVRKDLRALGISPNLLAELEVTMARLDRVDPVHRPAGPAEAPEVHHRDDEPIATHRLPYDVAAAEILRDARGVLSTWVRHLVETRYGAALDGLSRDAFYRSRAGAGAHGPWRAGPELPANELPAMAGWLGRHTESVRADPGAGELAADVAALAMRARRLLTPEELEYLAYCEHCAEQDPPAYVDLYVARGASVAACPRCRTSFDVAARRDLLLESARDYLATATEVSRALVDYVRGHLGDNESLTPAAIRGLAKRGRLAGRPPAPGESAPRYRLGDVMDLVTARANTHPVRRTR